MSREEMAMRFWGTTPERAWRWLIIAGGLLFAALAWSHAGLAPSTVSAHGKEVNITVSSLAPDKDKPLTKLYRVMAKFDDGDPLTEGNVQLVARRSQGGLEVGPVALSPLNEPGVYAGEITYPRYGTWTVTVTVLGDAGEGTTTFDEELLPGGDAQPNAQPGEEPVRRLQVFFRFGVRDVAHIVGRILHSAAASAYILFTGAVLLVIWFRASQTNPAAWAWLRRAFFPGTLGAATAMLVSGLYSAYYDAPVKPPGVFPIAGIEAIPYGHAYLVAFWLKAPLALALLVVALRMHRAMNPDGQPRSIAGASIDTAEDASSTPQVVPSPSQLLLRLSLAYVTVSLLLLANIAVLIYLHYISHLGAIVPPA